MRVFAVITALSARSTLSAPAARARRPPSPSPPTRDTTTRRRRSRPWRATGPLAPGSAPSPSRRSARSPHSRASAARRLLPGGTRPRAGTCGEPAYARCTVAVLVTDHAGAGLNIPVEAFDQRHGGTAARRSTSPASTPRRRTSTPRGAAVRPVLLSLRAYVHPWRIIACPTRTCATRMAQAGGGGSACAWDQGLPRSESNVVAAELPPLLGDKQRWCLRGLKLFD
ncbi:predicted protein [Postia placenta Mad-698-R]|nr:predicted protein [Postia placenta Mad-698-R]